MEYGFFKVAAATPYIRVSDCQFNANAIKELYLQAVKKGAGVIVTPQLAVTGSTCYEMLLQPPLISAAEKAILELAEATRGQNAVLIAGFPHRHAGKIYNCAAVMFEGKIKGIVPKSFGGGGRFSGFENLDITKIGSDEVTFGDQIFDCGNNITFGVELDDFMSASLPSDTLCRAGALIIFNLAAQPETVKKVEYRRTFIKAHSAKTISAYVYCNAGEGESTTEAVYAGHNIIAENGKILAESKPFTTGLLTADIDIDRLLFERAKCDAFDYDSDYRHENIDLKPIDFVIERKFSPTPFIPADKEELFERCEEILSILTQGLKTRLVHTGIKKIVLGLSGGLDSTLTMIVSSRALKEIGQKPEDLICFIMPSENTSMRTRENAAGLAKHFGATVITVDITKAVEGHLKDIGHQGGMDVVYENAQARERTQILMDYANMVGGIMVGTGDLSEEALGFCTYNGDHMSMFNVISSIPKTLVKALVEHEAQKYEGEKGAVLYGVAQTPASPELKSEKDGKMSQKTEDIIGPYLLHDFFLYYFNRYGYPPEKIFKVASLAFEGQFTQKEILKWLKVFFERFFATQFKRACAPDSVKTGSVSLSKGDFYVPSDATAKEWLKRLDNIKV